MPRRLSIISIFLVAVSFLAHAADLPYGDVSSDTWYRDEVQTFMDAGYLDATQPNFRPGDLANRAEFMKLIVEVNGGILDETPLKPSFDDVRPGEWYYAYLEEAAREKWLQGDGGCLGTHPCTARPAAPITRAEAAVIIRRAFGKKRLGKAPAFSDNPAGEWFTEAIQAAADHCILRGDDGARTVRPHDPVNRAEMVAMLARVDGGGEYPGCR